VGVKRNTGAHPEVADSSQGSLEMNASLHVNRQNIRTGFDEFVEKRVGVRDHQVNIDRETCCTTDRTDNKRTDRDVGDEMSINDIDVNPVRTALVRRRDFVVQAGEIGRKN
jgi:hypothetical protein